VVEGDVVSQCDILARLHDTKFQSSVDELRDQIAALEIRRLRLEAEMALLRARQLDFTSRRQGTQRILEQAQAETELLENMLKKKVVALIEVTRARKVLADAQVKLDDILTHSELELATEYSDTLKELATLRQNLRASQDQLNRTVLQSPMRGVVNNVSVTTIGGVVRPGEEILQIIPLDEELFVAARVKPENIVNIRPGQEATIKLRAYDYTIFGTLKGRVDVISADTFKDDRTRAEDGNAHYKVRVRVDVGGLTDKQARIEIRPGMQAQVELHTGEKTVLQYLLKPLYKSREAFREP
jgi:adhesin transport system membrane fusion protein